MQQQDGFTFTTSSSSVQPKRKHAEDEELDFHQQPLQTTVPMPPMKRRATVTDTPFGLPDLVPDHSNCASDDDVAMDGDQDQGMEETLDSPISGDVDTNDREESDLGVGIGRSLAYGEMGTGGFGFGPGAEEDDMMQEEGRTEATLKNYPTVYPSLTAHPNPNHFSNLAPYTNTQRLPIDFRPNSPLSAQAFTTALAAPPARNGLFQPAVNEPLGPDATDIEKARAAHGPQCKSIPKLTVSPYPDLTTGNQSMYSLCPDCGTIEKV